MENNYTIIKKIGQGGYGQVLLVKDSKNNICVLKNVPLKNPPKYTLNEFYVMRALNHPRIIKLLDFYPSSNSFNFILEYAENGSLRDLIVKYQMNRWKLSNDNLLKFFVDIAVGVEYLHMKNIIHRDLKPENILADSNYRLKLCDFGISKVASSNNPQFQTSIGTLSYMSPEVYLHKPYDSSCDLWALGLILYEMAFMKYMFTREDKCRIMDFTKEYECPEFDWKARGYNFRFQYILEMMIQRDPKRRFTMQNVCRHSILYPLVVQCKKEAMAYKLSLK